MLYIPCRAGRLLRHGSKSVRQQLVSLYTIIVDQSEGQNRLLYFLSFTTTFISITSNVISLYVKHSLLMCFHWTTLLLFYLLVILMFLWCCPYLVIGTDVCFIARRGFWQTVAFEAFYTFRGNGLDNEYQDEENDCKKLEILMWTHKYKGIVQ